MQEQLHGRGYRRQRDNTFLKQLIVAFVSAPFRFYSVETKVSETCNVTLDAEGIITFLNERIISGNKDN